MNPIQPAGHRGTVSILEYELRNLRQASLIATRKRDFRTVARLTLEATRLSRELLEAQAESAEAIETAGGGSRL